MKADKELFQAVELGSTEAIRLALARGANINAKNSNGETALHMAFDFWKKANREVVQCLIDAGADYTLTNRTGHTAYQMCVERDVKLIDIFINAGLHPNTRLASASTALHWAAIEFEAETMQFLIDRGADVNVRDKRGLTPIFDAMCLVYFAPTEILLKANADINVVVREGDDNYSMLGYFLNRLPLDDNRNKIHYNSFKNFLKFLLKYKVDLNARNDQGWTYVDWLLYECIDYHSQTNMIKAFIVIGGADVNGIYTPDNTHGDRLNMTILHRACEIKNYELVETLLKLGANVNALDNSERSPLMYAIDEVGEFGDNSNPEERLKFYSTDVEIVRYLLKHNADINVIVLHNDTNVLNCIFDSPGFLWKMLVRHIAKQQALGVRTNRSLKDTIQEEQDSETELNYSSYFFRCECELQELKNQMIPSERTITFFNLLVDDKRKLDRYAEKPSLVADFYKIDFASNYEIYGEEIEQRFTRVIQNKEALKYSQILLSAWMRHRFDPDNLAVRKIIGYFSKKELRELCKNFKTEIMLLKRPL